MALAAQYRMPALALTDHGNLFGAIEFYRKAVKAGVKPILGCEVYVAPGSRFDKSARRPDGQARREEESSYHLILLARNNQGYKNLIKLVTAGYMEGFYYRPRIDKELLREHAEGLLALSGCLASEVPQLLLKGRYEQARETARWFRDALGEENYYLEIQENGLEEQLRVNRGLFEISKDLGIPFAATNDSHYLRKEDARAHEILLCISTGSTLEEQDRFRFASNEFYVKSPEEIAQAFTAHPEAVANTVRIAERCNVELRFDAIHLPHYAVPGHQSKEAYLVDLARTGLEERLNELERAGRLQKKGLVPEQYWQRLERELEVIARMGFAGYFLIVWDIIRYAKERGIPVGPGRGSSAGSLVAYALRITDIDPLAYGLLFERFLNPERVSLPDIDIDFCKERRDEVIQYLTEKYGKDHVCQIITFGSMNARAAIRDVGRALNIPYAEVDRVAKLVPEVLGITLEKALEMEPRLKEAARANSKIAELLDLAQALEGITRHASTHAAGVVIAKEPLIEHVPLYRGTRAEDVIVTQYPMNDIAAIGLVKFDLLGLKTLTVLEMTVRHINRRRAEQGVDPLRLDTLPLDDAKTFALIASGETAGVFQLESSGMRDLAMKMKPSVFEDLVALVALFRPGPLQSGMADDFVKRKRGQTPVRYEHPLLEPILKDTYGVILYQEQVMQIATDLAGFTPSQADLLRRAMGKKKPEEMDKQKAAFLDGAKRKGIAEKKAGQIFDLMAHFAGYGFNKSHSVAYALLAYQTAHLKAHDPVEFMAALLTSERENTDKVVRYTTACREMEIALLPPDINASEQAFAIEQGKIRFGLSAIKNVGDSAIEAILEARVSGGPFDSLFDFCRRVNLQKVNKRVIECLIKCGAFDATGAKRSQLTAVLDQAVEEGAKLHDDRARGQQSFFETLSAPHPASSALGGGSPLTSHPASGGYPDLPEWPEHQRLAAERELLGFYITGHPLARYEAEIRRYAQTDTLAVEEITDGKEATLCGVVNGLRERVTKRKGEKMATFLLEDLMGTVEVLVFPDLYRQTSAILTGDAPLLVTGITDRTEQGVKLKAVKIALLSEARQRATNRLSITLQTVGTTGEDLVRLREILLRHRGLCPCALRLVHSDRRSTLIALGEAFRVACTDALLDELETAFGSGVVTLGASLPVVQVGSPEEGGRNGR
jgi:DNA polymerase-3 subunit alpha